MDQVEKDLGDGVTLIDAIDFAALNFKATYIDFQDESHDSNFAQKMQNRLTNLSHSAYHELITDKLSQKQDLESVNASLKLMEQELKKAEDSAAQLKRTHIKSSLFSAFKSAAVFGAFVYFGLHFNEIGSATKYLMIPLGSDAQAVQMIPDSAVPCCVMGGLAAVASGEFYKAFKNYKDASNAKLYEQYYKAAPILLPNDTLNQPN
jgi:hypothetical protein